MSWTANVLLVFTVWICVNMCVFIPRRMHVSWWTQKSSALSDLAQIKLTAFGEGHTEEHQKVNYFHCIFETRKGQPLLLKLFKAFKSIYPFLSIPRLKDSMNDLIWKMLAETISNPQTALTRPGTIQSMGLRRVRHSLASEQQQTCQDQLKAIYNRSSSQTLKHIFSWNLHINP